MEAIGLPNLKWHPLEHNKEGEEDEVDEVDEGDWKGIREATNQVLSNLYSSAQPSTRCSAEPCYWIVGIRGWGIKNGWMSTDQRHEDEDGPFSAVGCLNWYFVSNLLGWPILLSQLSSSCWGLHSFPNRPWVFWEIHDTFIVSLRTGRGEASEILSSVELKSCSRYGHLVNFATIAPGLVREPGSHKHPLLCYDKFIEKTKYTKPIITTSQPLH